MDAEQAKKLREPFPPEAIGKLPKVTCGNCSRDKQRKHCDSHQRAKCGVCQNYITTAHMHLDYVGHAELTDRLLQVDPEWSWEPVAFDQGGLPAMDRVGGLWIRLTIAGVTRLGYGAAAGKDGPDAVKEIIGDALRNAGMRFGIALDLWGAHGGGQDPADEEPAVGRGEAPQQRQPEQRDDRQSRAPQRSEADEARDALLSACEHNGWDSRRVAASFKQRTGQDIGTTQDAEAIRTVTQALAKNPAEVLGQPEPAGAPS